VRTKELTQEINRTLIECKARSTTFSEFCSHMKSSGFEVKPSYNKQGAMFGMRINAKGESFKLSEINRNIKHYHFADILPKETLIQSPSFSKMMSHPKGKADSNLIRNTIANQFKSSLGKEVQTVFKAVDIASSLSPAKLAVNVAKSIIRGMGRGMSL